MVSTQVMMKGRVDRKEGVGEGDGEWTTGGGGGEETGMGKWGWGQWGGGQRGGEEGLARAGMFDFKC